MSNNNGFTLIEFLVATVIMMIGLLGLLQAVNVGLVHNLNSQLRSEAVSVADLHLSHELSKSFDLVSTSTGNSVELRPILGGLKRFDVVRSGMGLSNSKQVNITVSWSHKGIRYQHEASSVISKNQ